MSLYLCRVSLTVVPTQNPGTEVYGKGQKTDKSQKRFFISLSEQCIYTIFVKTSLYLYICASLSFSLYLSLSLSLSLYLCYVQKLPRPPDTETCAIIPTRTRLSFPLKTTLKDPLDQTKRPTNPEPGDTGSTTNF